MFIVRVEMIYLFQEEVCLILYDAGALEGEICSEHAYNFFSRGYT